MRTEVESVVFSTRSSVNRGEEGIIPPYRGEQPLSPYRTDAGFSEAQLRDDEAMKRYVDRPRAGSVSPGAWVMRDIALPNARNYQASNRHGRLLLSGLMLRAVREGIPPNVDIFFVSITPRRYVLPVTAPDKTFLKSLRFFARQAVGNSTGLGVIEPALYLGCRADGPRLYGDVISWHAHMLVWGVSLDELRRHRDALGPQHVGMTGRCCVWIKPIDIDEAEIYARYICKAPTTQYRLQRNQGEEVDDETGEIFYKYQQNKEPLRPRPRHLVRLANVMEDLFMDDLVFGSGAGGPIIRGLVQEITAARRREDKRLDQRRLIR